MWVESASQWAGLDPLREESSPSQVLVKCVMESQTPQMMKMMMIGLLEAKEMLMKIVLVKTLTSGLRDIDQTRLVSVQGLQSHKYV